MSAPCLSDTSSSSGLSSDELSPCGFLLDSPSWFPAKNAHRDIRQLLTFHKPLGQGMTGSVFEATYRGKLCAVKQITQSDKLGTMLFGTEARSLSRLRHRNIIGFVDMLRDEDFYYLVLEKADYDLYDLLTQNGRGFLTENTSRDIVRGLLCGLRYIHKKNLVHRDLKPENVVFAAANPLQPKIIDFGDAEIARVDKIYTEFVRTPPYMSPERLTEHNGEQLKKADVWAVGVMAFEMFTGRRCFDGATQKEVFAKVLRGDWQWDASRVPSAAMQNFVAQCLSIDSDDRLSAEEALQHEWIAGTDV